MTSRALLVDDLEENRYLLAVLLKGYGYEVHTAANGAEALALAIQNLPDIIISDILMPTMDGFTLCMQCKNDPRLKHIPFIFYTATYTEPKDEKFALSLGADAFLMKPIEPSVLIRRINEVVANPAKDRGDNRAENEPAPQINLKKYNEVLIHKLEKKMAELDSSNRELHESEDRYRSLFERVPVGLYRTTTDGQIVEANPALLDLLGYQNLDELQKKPVLSGYYNPEERQRWQTLMAQAEVVEGFETEWLRQDGSVIWVEESARRIVDLDGKVIFYEGSVRNITQRKQVEEELRNLNADLEKRVQDRTAQLEMINKELEAFSYSVSHDLRAPLRAMDGFSSALMENYAGQLDETGLRYLTHIYEASQRMKLLIEDLLTLSRLTRVGLNSTQVNLSEIAARLAAALSEAQPKRQTQWDIASNVIVNGDGRLLEVALSNLFNNAYKFTSQHATTRIEFGTIDQNGETVYFVRDDGAGFDMIYAGRLFGAFQRLHSSTTFEGTGIGLTIVQRIITRHGGRIWAEGAIEQGATFYFTLG